MPSTALKLAVFCLLTLIWGTTWAAIKIGLKGVPPFTGAAVRFAVASLLLLALVPLFRVRLGREPRERLLWAVNCLCSFFGPYAVVYWTQQWMPSGLASVLFASFPLFVAIFAHFLLPEERLQRLGVVGLAVGFSGVAVIFSDDLGSLGGPELPGAIALFMVAPVVSALGEVFVKARGKGVHPLSITSVPMGGAALLLGLAAAAGERDLPVTFDASTISSILYLAVFGSAVTFCGYFWLLGHMEATRLALMAYLIPLVATTVGVFVLGETLSLRTIAGGALILGGVYLANRGLRRAEPPG